MPIVSLITNVKIANANKAFVLEFSKFAAETLGKPEAYVNVNVTYNETLTFAGTFDPAITLRIDSLDNINRESNEKYSKAFFEFFQKKLGVPGNRGFISFIDPGRGNLGHESTTFATIFGQE